MSAMTIFGLVVACVIGASLLVALIVVALAYHEDPLLRREIEREAEAVVEEVLNGTYHLRSQESPNT